MSKLQERDVLLEPWFSISIGGNELGEDMLKYVSSVEVTDEENKLSEAIIEVEDYDRKWLDGAGIGKGNTIIVRMGHIQNNNTPFRGKITFIDADYPEEGFPTLTISAVDSGIKMMETRQTKVYKKKKVSDVIKTLHKDAGLEIEVEDTKTVLDHIQQTKETASEFSHRWKKKLGWKYFKKPTGGYYFGTKNISDFPVETLGYRTGGLEIISFTPTFSEVETEEKDKEKELENKKADAKSNEYKAGAKPKAGSSGSDKVAGRA